MYYNKTYFKIYLQKIYENFFVVVWVQDVLMANFYIWGNDRLHVKLSNVFIWTENESSFHCLYQIRYRKLRLLSGLTSPADIDALIFGVLLSLVSMCLSAQSQRIKDRLFSRLDVRSLVLLGGWLLALDGFLDTDSCDSSLSNCLLG